MWYVSIQTIHWNSPSFSPLTPSVPVIINTRQKIIEFIVQEEPKIQWPPFTRSSSKPKTDFDHQEFALRCAENLHILITVKKPASLWWSRLRKDVFKPVAESTRNKGEPVKESRKKQMQLTWNFTILKWQISIIRYKNKN